MKDKLGGKIMIKDDDKITTYPYGASAGKACKTELLRKVNIK